MTIDKSIYWAKVANNAVFGLTLLAIIALSLFAYDRWHSLWAFALLLSMPAWKEKGD